MPKLIKYDGEVREYMPANLKFFTIEEIWMILDSVYSVSFINKFVGFYCDDFLKYNLQYNILASKIFKKHIYGDALIVEQKFLPPFFFYPYVIRDVNNKIYKEDFETIYKEIEMKEKSLQMASDIELEKFVENFVRETLNPHKIKFEIENFNIEEFKKYILDQLNADYPLIEKNEDNEDNQFDDYYDDEEENFEDDDFNFESLNNLILEEKLELNFNIKNLFFRKINFFYIMNLIYNTIFFRTNVKTFDEVKNNFVFLDKGGIILKLTNDKNKLKMIEYLYNFFIKYEDINSERIKKLFNFLVFLKEKIDERK